MLYKSAKINFRTRISKIHWYKWTNKPYIVTLPMGHRSPCSSVLRLSAEMVETCVWLSCDITSKDLKVMSGFPGALLTLLTTGGWTGILPSSILTTDDMGGLRVGEGLVHRRAKVNILIASSFKYFEPRVGSTTSKRLPCSCRVRAFTNQNKSRQFWPFLVRRTGHDKLFTSHLVWHLD